VSKNTDNELRKTITRKESSANEDRVRIKFSDLSSLLSIINAEFLSLPWKILPINRKIVAIKIMTTLNWLFVGEVSARKGKLFILICTIGAMQRKVIQKLHVIPWKRYALEIDK
jgi:hypothetical protein